MRDTYKSLEQIMLKEKGQALYIMESNHQQYMKEFVKKFESMSNVKIVWNSNELHYEVTRI